MNHPAPNNDPIFPQCRFHQERLDKLEDMFQTISLTTARIEERLTSMDSKIDGVASIVDNGGEKTVGIILENQKTALRVAALEATEHESLGMKKAIGKWVAGILAVILGSYVLNKLGLGK